MNLKEKINLDLKEARKAKDKLRLQVIRSLRALILEFEKSGSQSEMSSADEIKILTGAAKKRKEAFEQYQNANRNDLAEIEKAELEIIQAYLPKQLNNDEILLEIEKIAKQVEAKSKEDFPKLMPAVMKELKGKADGKTVKDLVQQFLSR